MAILYITMIYKIISATGIIVGLTMIGVGIGLSIAAVIIGGIVFMSIGVIGCMMAKMYLPG
jgi:hypothetical protein